MSRARCWSIGLSPRVRGNPRSADTTATWSRSIPACTGEPSRIAARSSAAGVYPRVYGGTLSGKKNRTQNTGLSPRVRGNLDLKLERRPHLRSIPACTGEPAGPGPGRSSGRVYPRVYGGTIVLPAYSERLPGLSPRVRGNQLSRPQQGYCEGSIPACTGEPRTRSRSLKPTRVYPRVYGGTPCKYPNFQRASSKMSRN